MKGIMVMNGRIVSSLFVIVLAVIIVGCTKSEGPVTGNAGVPVSLAASFSKAGTGLPLMKTGGVAAVDSIRIDSAVVVLAEIEFRVHIDSTKIDSMGDESDGEKEEDELTFKGPFVIHVRDTLSINFADQVLPAGSYDGIKFKIHRLGYGEHHMDSDEHNGRSLSVNDSSSLGSSIVIWGSVKKDGSWTPFVFKFNGEVKFKIKGNFVVKEATGTVQIALNFNIASWLKNPFTGGVLDPTDTSSGNRELINRAIRSAFGHGRGGHDHNHDGHPDD